MISGRPGPARRDARLTALGLRVGRAYVGGEPAGSASVERYRKWITVDSQAADPAVWPVGGTVARPRHPG